MDEQGVVLEALGHPVRRAILGALLERDGQRADELASAVGVGRSRFGRQVGVLERAGLVAVVRAGRERHHWLRAGPVVGLEGFVARFRSRWVEATEGALERFHSAEDRLSGAAGSTPLTMNGGPLTMNGGPLTPDGELLTTNREPLTLDGGPLATNGGPSTTNGGALAESAGLRVVLESHIRTSAWRLWLALTSGPATRRYFFGCRVVTSWVPQSPVEFRGRDGAVMVRGRVLVYEAPRRLGFTWQVVEDPGPSDPAGRVWFRIEESRDWCRLTLVHEGLMAGIYPSALEGWRLVLDSLKSLLETGAALHEITAGRRLEAAVARQLQRRSQALMWRVERRRVERMRASDAL